MKVLLDHALPFALAHGGFQIQIQRTMAALSGHGVDVEPLRWWDETQRADIIHFFGRPSGGYIDFAQAKGMKVVVEELHSAMGSRSHAARLFQKLAMKASQQLLPRGFTSRLAWDAYRKADAFIANTELEGQIMRRMFDADPRRVHVIPNGVEPTFMREHIGGEYLVCTAAIHPRKRVLELARAAAAARVPVRIIGKPYAESDPYYRAFLALCAEKPAFVRYDGPVSSRDELAEIYATARGFVLLSTQETLSLSSFEAAAAGCPLLLSDLPWARTTFGNQAQYVPSKLSGEKLGAELRNFYEAATQLPVTFRPPSWPEVGAMFVAVYREIL